MSSYLTTTEAAAALGCAAAHIRRLCLAGKLPGAEHWGRDWRIPAPAIAQYQAEKHRPGRPAKEIQGE